jgi:hypothetical protein
MESEFKLKALRYEELLQPSGGSDKESVGVVSDDLRGEGEEVAPSWLKDYMEKGTLPQAPSPVPQAAPYHECVALMVMKADATSKDATWSEALVDYTVQFGQPYPAVTHVELWIGDRPTEPAEDNHFSTYLGAKRGALWTSGLTDSKKFYSSTAWSAIPIFASDVERRMRSECNLHCGTPYPPVATLWQYPMSIWPLRGLSGFLDDRINAPAHCAALSARILRSALPEIALLQPSHWYGPSSLYLELSAPERMEQALAVQRPVVRSLAEEREEDRLADMLTMHSDDEVIEMHASEARQALHALSIKVLAAGSRQGDQGQQDQDKFRVAQERLARGLTRYTWLNRKLKRR